jgi:hypothetical protein
MTASDWKLEEQATHDMLKLPLRTRSRCSCIVIVVILVAVGLAFATRGYMSRRNADLVPTAVAHSSLTPAQPLPTATATNTATATPAAINTPLPTATDTSTVTHTPTTTNTPLPAATNTPLATPAATNTPAATDTPLPTLTPTSTNTPAATNTPLATPAVATTPGWIVCDATVMSVIEGAAAAQAAYMEGGISATDLAETWGAAAPYARSQADQMVFYRTAQISEVRITGVEWEILSCQMQAAGSLMRVVLTERWRYQATLSCSPDGTHSSTWSEVFPAETFALVREGEGWRIDSWLTGPVEVEQWWTCP